MRRTALQAIGRLMGFLALVLVTPSVQGETSSAHLTGIELSAATQRSLQQLGERAVQWNKAYLQEDRPGAERELEGVLELVHSLGMKSLPDLSLVALGRAVEAAEGGDFGRAVWALEAAEKLDPGRPETAFARAAVHRLEGSYAKAFIDSLTAYARVFWFPVDRALWFHNLLLWGLFSVLLSAVLYIVLLIALHGQAVMVDLADLLARPLPKFLALGLTVVLLVGPFFLPYGLLWFFVLWSVLLWGYGSAQERIVLTLIWLLAGAVPILVTEQKRHVGVSYSPAVKALRSLERGRLHGSLFTDLGVLRAVLPESPEVQHLVADFHASLGQWDIARSLYRQVLDQEPQNAAALNNLGVYLFLRGDNGGAARNFEKASNSDPESAEAFFNLSQAFGASYLYQDSRRALQKAQRIDRESVGQWIQVAETESVHLVQGGVGRIRPILKQLLGTSASPGEVVLPILGGVRRGFSLLVGCALVLIAAALHLARRGFGYTQGISGGSGGGNAADLLLRVLVPGLSSAREGEGFASFFAFLPIVGLILLPLSWKWGYRLPWGFESGSALPWVVATLGIVVLLIGRLLRQRYLEGA